MSWRWGVALVAVLLAGCAARADVPEEPAPTGLLGALAGVRAVDGAAEFVEYGDVAAVRALVARDPERFRGLEGYGYSPLAAVGGGLADVVGFDPARATSALRVGRSAWASVVRAEVDVAAVEARLTALGGRRDGSGTWTTAADGAVSPDGPLARVGVVTGFQRVRVAPGSVVHATGGEALGWVTEPGDRTLAADPMIGELARCLGEVPVALVAKPKTGLPVAVGVRASPTATGEATEVVCVPDENPKALAGRVRDNLGTGAATGGEPWSTALPGALVEQPADQSGVVRVLVPAGPGTRAGRVLLAWQRGDLPALFS
ncbi:hypothetical protein [Saccharothrix lopnurensis]|uniref:Uncharacterized protein n=1 Tax=Saccharothrix lopnurensis TaxID=1670621 RepID=A0ABW1P805_9PSEU